MVRNTDREGPTPRSGTTHSHSSRLKQDIIGFSGFRMASRGFVPRRGSWRNSAFHQRIAEECRTRWRSKKMDGTAPSLSRHQPAIPLPRGSPVLVLLGPSAKARRRPAAGLPSFLRSRSPVSLHCGAESRAQIPPPTKDELCSVAGFLNWIHLSQPDSRLCPWMSLLACGCCDSLVHPASATSCAGSGFNHSGLKQQRRQIGASGPGPDRRLQVLEDRSPLLRAGRDHGSDSFAPAVSPLGHRPLRDQTVDHRDADRLFRQVVRRLHSRGRHELDRGCNGAHACAVFVVRGLQSSFLGTLALNPKSEMTYPGRI